jgi:hypothetical protein
MLGSQDWEEANFDRRIAPALLLLQDGNPKAEIALRPPYPIPWLDSDDHTPSPLDSGNLLEIMRKHPRTGISVFEISLWHRPAQPP